MKKEGLVCRHLVSYTSVGTGAGAEELEDYEERADDREDFAHEAGGVVAIYRKASGRAHTTNLSHDLKISRGTKTRMMVMGRV